MDDDRVFEAIGAIERHALTALWLSGLQRRARLSTPQAYLQGMPIPPQSKPWGKLTGLYPWDDAKGIRVWRRSYGVILLLVGLYLHGGLRQLRWLGGLL